MSGSPESEQVSCDGKGLMMSGSPGLEQELCNGKGLMKG